MSVKGKKLRTPHSQILSLPSQGIGLMILHPLSLWGFVLYFPISSVTSHRAKAERRSCMLVKPCVMLTYFRQHETHANISILAVL